MRARACLALAALLASLSARADDGARSVPADAAERPLRASFAADVGVAAFAAGRGDGVLVPLELEAMIIRHLGFTLGADFGAGTGPGSGLAALGVNASLQWYPLSTTALAGFSIGPKLRGQIVADVSNVFGAPKWTAGATLQYAWILQHRVTLCAGADVTILGIGWPEGWLLAPRLAVGWAL